MNKKTDTTCIVSDPLVLNGAPTVQGTRVSVVQALAYMKLRPYADAASDLGLTREQYRACVAYARENWPAFFVAFTLLSPDDFLLAIA